MMGRQLFWLNQKAMTTTTPTLVSATGEPAAPTSHAAKKRGKERKSCNDDLKALKPPSRLRAWPKQAQTQHAAARQRTARAEKKRKGNPSQETLLDATRTWSWKQLDTQPLS